MLAAFQSRELSTQLREPPKQHLEFNGKRLRLILRHRLRTFCAFASLFGLCVTLFGLGKSCTQLLEFIGVGERLLHTAD